MKHDQTKGIGMDNHKQRQNIIERVDTLETAYRALVAKTQDTFNKLIEEINTNYKWLEAVTEILGKDIIESKVKEIFVNRCEAGVAEQEDMLTKALTEGRLAVNAAVEPGNLLVVREKNAAGEIKHPSKIFQFVGTFQENVINLLLGKAVGDTISLENGDTLEIVGIYKQIEAPAEAVNTEV